MKKLFITLMLATAACASAQVNPQRGYIINNSSDTIRGTLDYRTAEINCSECTFKADGESEFQTYLPGDIREFRFEHNGKNYASHVFTLAGKTTPVFAELLVKGKMNLYFYSGRYSDRYFFENERGEVADYDAYANRTRQNEEATLEALKPLVNLLQYSPSAMALVDARTMTRNRLINIARAYHNDLSPNKKQAIEYRHKEAKTSSSKTRLRIIAGYNHKSPYALNGAYSDADDYKGGCSSIFLGLGVETPIAQVDKGLAFQGEVGYSKAHFAGVGSIRDNNENEINHHILDFTAGVAYKFSSEGKIRPFVRGGALFDIVFNRNDKDDFGGLGCYVGTGLEVPVGKQYLTLTVDYRRNVFVNHNAGITACVGWTF